MSQQRQQEVHRTQKHRNFVSEPMGNKPATALPGVGKVTGQRLGDAGVHRADQVFGQYLVQGRTREPFQQWMKNTSGSTVRDAAYTYECLDEYKNQFM